MSESHAEIGPVTIYHTTDLHDHRKILLELMKVPKDVKTLFLDSGDAIGGSNTAFRFSEPIVDMMNRIPYDAMAMGNREFNYLRWVLKIRHRQARFPVLCANLQDQRGCADNYYSPYLIKEIGGMKLGIIGLTPVQYEDGSFWHRVMGFSFKDPFKTAEKLVSELKDRTDYIILLSHLGLEQDEKMARMVDGIHLIIGGHSHVLLEKPLRVNDSFIFNAGAFGGHYGRILFEKPTPGESKVQRLQYQLIKVS